MIYVSRPGVVIVETSCTIGVVSQLLLMMIWLYLAYLLVAKHITARQAMHSHLLLKPSHFGSSGWHNDLPKGPIPNDPSLMATKRTRNSRQEGEGGAGRCVVCMLCVYAARVCICWFDLI